MSGRSSLPDVFLNVQNRIPEVFYKNVVLKNFPFWMYITTNKCFLQNLTELNSYHMR